MLFLLQEEDTHRGCPPPAFSVPLPPHVNGRSPISVKPAPHSTGEAAAHILPQITGVDPLHCVAVL